MLGAGTRRRVVTAHSVTVALCSGVAVGALVLFPPVIRELALVVVVIVVVIAAADWWQQR